ncbi:MAG TPA: hypothetical protein VK428_10255, partial [Acidimicrobiales bacterium]|nr:hypothetical protein [Acidimicrobiales bacterium]
MAELRGERWETAKAYGAAVWHHWKLVVLDIVLGVLAVVDSAGRFRTTSQSVTKGRLVHHPFLPWWVWVAG